MRVAAGKKDLALLLLDGGALRVHESGDGVAIHPDGRKLAIKRDYALDLVRSGKLFLVGCGCNCFWYALSPDTSLRHLVASGLRQSKTGDIRWVNS